MMLCRSGMYYSSEPSSVALPQVSSFPTKEVSGFSWPRLSVTDLRGKHCFVIWALNKFYLIVTDTSPGQRLYSIYCNILFYKEAWECASSNKGLYLKIETIIQYLVSRVASQLLSLYVSHPLYLSHPIFNSVVPILPFLSPLNIVSIPLFHFPPLPPSYLLILLAPCSSSATPKLIFSTSIQLLIWAETF